MQLKTQRLMKYIIIAISISVFIILITLSAINVFKRPSAGKITSKKVPEKTIIHDTKTNSNSQTPQSSKPESLSDSKAESSKGLPKTEPICVGNKATSSNFTLSASAQVYNTALDAKNKTNPSGTYQPNQYYVFRCYDGMVNITRAQGSPGGWIDTVNPYQNSTQALTKPLAIDFMMLDNTVINWSHEYPTTFVKDYKGLWNISPKKLYLTFDCGYDYNNLASTIMDTLSSKNIKAVFFVTGDFMNKRPDLIKRMANEGHIVGNHSYAHLNQPQNLNTSTNAITTDIQIWETKYQSVMASNPPIKYFRPPDGAISKRSMALMSQLGYKTLMWGAAYKDWDTAAQPTAEGAMTLLRKYTTPGDIVLLHGISQTSSDILGQYIDEYRGKGFEFSLP